MLCFRVAPIEDCSIHQEAERLVAVRRWRGTKKKRTRQGARGAIVRVKENIRSEKSVAGQTPFTSANFIIPT
ncbi:hypothetical protein OJAV_G00235470 [Oryzias javanicus]|uniref:Uncharacterized protein n=1 Tax=Oryzias javanicus TaxID=123683 RepID=A0A3S2P2K6_ORYJA|nr:hypothetical protein OJAV_G00235470 [Oryzias javanicus]